MLQEVRPIIIQKIKNPIQIVVKGMLRLRLRLRRWSSRLADSGRFSWIYRSPTWHRPQGPQHHPEGYYSWYGTRQTLAFLIMKTKANFVKFGVPIRKISVHIDKPM